MKILDIKVDWMLGWANHPSLKLLVDRIPKMDELRFREKRSNYFAELDGFVQFFHYSGPGDGYGGDVFNIIMEDGTHKACKGPWSSRSSAMNHLGFTPSLECSMTTEKDVWKRGHTFYGCCATVEAIENAIPNFAIDLALDRVCLYSGDEPSYIPTLKGMGHEEAKRFMENQRFGFDPDGGRHLLRRTPWSRELEKVPMLTAAPA